MLKKKEKAKTAVLLFLVFNPQSDSRSVVNPFVNATENTKEHDACGADCEGSLGVVIAAECWKRIIGTFYIHCLYYE